MSSTHRHAPRTDVSSVADGTTRDAVATVLAAHGGVLDAGQAASPAIAAAVDVVIAALGCGGRLIYVGAGTSGWLAALDAAEAVVTFGMRGRITSVVGGGLTLDPTPLTTGDDDVDGAHGDATLAAIGPRDAVIAVSASGSTPFTCAAAQVARAHGTRIVALVATADSPLAADADVEVRTIVGAEVIGGSTRLAAGLAHKLVLNTISTVAMVRLGRAIDGHMVCVEPLNDKLRDRAVAAVAAACGVTPDVAAATLAAAHGAGDVACVALLAKVDIAEARARVAAAHGDIRAALHP